MFVFCAWVCGVPILLKSNSIRCFPMDEAAGESRGDPPLGDERKPNGSLSSSSSRLFLVPEEASPTGLTSNPEKSGSSVV